MTSALYRFNLDCGRMGDLSGIFIADQKQIDKIEGKNIYFGEVLGKHSEIYIDDFKAESFLTKLTDNSEFIENVKKFISDGDETISGFSPVEYFEEYDE